MTLNQLLSRITELREVTRPRVLAFSIGTASHYSYDTPYYVTPVRGSSDFMMTGAVVRDVSTAVEIAQLLDGVVDVFFVDCEKKIEQAHFGADDAGNVEKAVASARHLTPMLTYKGNDITVDAIESLLVREVAILSGKQIAVVGAGNIGSKAALRLLERGNPVVLYSRSRERVERISMGLNEIKSRSTLSTARAAGSLQEALEGAHVVLATATSTSVIDRESLERSGIMGRLDQSVLVDVGKGCFAEDAVMDPRVTIFRLDVGPEQLSQFRLRFEMMGWAADRATRAQHASGLSLVRQGIVGSRGEVVVDDVTSPSVVLGVCDGVGGIDWTATEQARHLLFRRESDIERGW